MTQLVNPEFKLLKGDCHRRSDPKIGIEPLAVRKGNPISPDLLSATAPFAIAAPNTWSTSPSGCFDGLPHPIEQPVILAAWSASGRIDQVFEEGVVDFALFRFGIVDYILWAF